MPTYVYRFLDSDCTIEVHQPFTEDALTEAVNPFDGLLHPVKKVFTPVGVTFKGSGFYKNDARGKSSSGSSANGSSESGSGSTAPASTNGESSSGSSSESTSSPSTPASTSTSSESTSAKPAAAPVS